MVTSNIFLFFQCPISNQTQPIPSNQTLQPTNSDPFFSLSRHTRTSPSQLTTPNLQGKLRNPDVICPSPREGLALWCGWSMISRIVRMQYIDNRTEWRDAFSSLIGNLPGNHVGLRLINQYPCERISINGCMWSCWFGPEWKSPSVRPCWCSQRMRQMDIFDGLFRSLSNVLNG